MNTKNISFVIFIIHKLAARWNIFPSQVYNVLKQYGCLDDYLIKHYEVLHTLSEQYILDDVELYLKNRGYGI